MNQLNQPTADLSACASITEMATAESMDPATYATCLASTISITSTSLDSSRERLFALSCIASRMQGAQASAEMLGQHLLILEALFLRFSLESHAALTRNQLKAPDVADKYLSAALRASRAALATMSALKILRDDANPTATATLLPPQAANLANAPLVLQTI